MTIEPTSRFRRGRVGLTAGCLALLLPALAGAASQPAKVRSDLRSGVASGRHSAFRGGVNLVLVPATVTDREGASVLGIERRSFKIFEDGIPQPIVSFSSEDAPCSIGLVLDASGSMRGRILLAKGAIRAFLEGANPEDEAFLMTFSNRPELRSSFTSDFTALQHMLLFSGASGSTALNDSMFLALQQMRHAFHPKKAIFVVSDGRDNNSRYTKKELLHAALETGLQIYTIGLGDTARTKEELLGDRSGIAFMEKLAKVTGGLHAEVRSFNKLTEAASNMGRALRSQYVVGYHAPPGDEDKWRKIRVRVTLPDGTAHVRVSARGGYAMSRRPE